jgi:hypothetical protein
MDIVLLLLHGLGAVALLGALSHQALAQCAPATRSPAPFIRRYAGVHASGFVVAIAALYVLVTVLGAWIYPAYRVDARIAFEELGMLSAVGAFELKEHAAAIGLGLLPLYLFAWRATATPEEAAARRWLTGFLALVVWYDFLAGHVLNNIRGIA